MTRHTDPGVVLGTVGYMSPEQVRGEELDARTDLFSLGVILYELATGQPPFSGDSSAEVLAGLLTREPTAPSRLNPRLPPDLERIILKCLDKDPDKRYQSARELGVDLRRLASASATQPRVAVRPRRRRWLPAFLALAVLLVAGLTLWPGLDRRRDRLSGQDPQRPIESLAVLPLANLTDDPGQQYFVDGMTEALIANLAKIGALKVISRTSAMRYKGSDKPLREIARELGVDAVIEGSVSRSGQEVKITAQLVHAASDTNLWAESYTGDLANIFGLQSEVAQAVAGRIRIAVTAEERAQLAPPGVVKPRAHEAYLQARQSRNLISRDGFELAIDWAGKAIEIDPGYARAYEILAEVYLLLGLYGFRRPREVFPLAKQNAAKALALDEALADAHSTMGWAVQVHDFDRVASEREYQRALELNPGHEITLMRYGAFLIGLGQTDRGMAMLERSIELDPMAPIMNALYAYGCYLTRDFDGAIAHSHKMAEWEPGFWWTHWNLGEALGALGKYEEAVEEAETAFALERNPFTGGGLAAAYARAGDPARAGAMLNSMLAKAEQHYVPPYFIALVQEALGRREQALDSLEKAWEERDSWFSFAAVTPALDSLREEPRLKELLRQMGLAAAAGAAI